MKNHALKLVNEAIDKEALEVFATPKISVIDLVPNLKLEAKVALKPNAKVASLNIKLDLNQDKISAKEVNNVIDQSRNQHASWVPVKESLKLVIFFRLILNVNLKMK